MRSRWWQSIRWRLTLASVLLALLTTTSLALTAIVVVNQNYGQDQAQALQSLASDKAQSISENYIQLGVKSDLSVAANNVLHKVSSGNGQQPIIIVLNKTSMPVYPPLTFSASGGGNAPHPTASAMRTATASVTPTILTTLTVRAQKTAIAQNATRIRAIHHALLVLVDPSIQDNDLVIFEEAIMKGLRGNGTVGEFGRDGPVGNAQPFVVQPIFNTMFARPRVIGVVIVTKPLSGIPPFVTAVGVAVFISALLIAVLAAVAAILFSQTITRPLARLTSATRLLTGGDYTARVTEHAPGELGELSHNFNEMAEQLKQDVEELRQQEVWRRELIMNITHDLATPLTAIAGLGESLMDGVNQSREDYEATGRIIMRETLRLRRLVQDLHVMAKMEAGALEPKPKVVRLAALVDEVLAMLAPEFERHQVEPNNAISFSLPAIEADPDMLTRVFSNLCNNSLRHTPAGGKVTIEAERQERMVLVSVTDTGEGIPEEALGRVFERFFRADSSRQSSTGGSGLGLAIVRAIIEAHGGMIWASNVPGAGARISFTLPVHVSEQQQVDAGDAPTQPVARKGLRGARLTRMET